MKITASEIAADTHIWIGDRLVYVASVRETMSGGVVSINGGDILLAPDKTVVKAF